jgi:uncharacterized protein involved in exopolysaccharide biosynthesis
MIDLLSLANLPASNSSEAIGWIIGGGAAAGAAVGGLLAFLRRESRVQEPQQERRVHGGPVTIQQVPEYISQQQHDDLKQSIEKDLSEIWKVINGLRKSVAHIEADLSSLSALRVASGERLNEMTGDVKQLSAIVHKLAGIVETLADKLSGITAGKQEGKR